jgi:hypothetical protein
MDNVISRWFSKSAADKIADIVWTAIVFIGGSLIDPSKQFIVRHPAWTLAMIGAAVVFVGVTLIFLLSILKARRDSEAFVRNWTWIKNEADTDWFYGAGRLQLLNAITATYDLLQSSPHIEFHFNFYNGSTWPVRVDSLEGFIVFGEVKCHGPSLQLLGKCDIDHGIAKSFTIRQWITSDQVRLMSEKVNNDDTKSLVLDTNNLKVYALINPDNLAERGTNKVQLSIGVCRVGTYGAFQAVSS